MTELEKVPHSSATPSIKMSNSSHFFCAIACYKQECPHCGVHLLKSKVEETNAELLQENTVMHWLQWHNTGIDADGKLTGVPQLIWQTGTVTDSLNCLWNLMEKFALHNFNAQWHCLQFS